VLLDVRMPRLDGPEAAQMISAAYPEVKVVMLTTFDDDMLIARAARSGACGYLLKDQDAREMAEAIRQVVRGGAVLAPSVAQKLFLAFGQQPQAGLDEPAEPIGTEAGPELPRLTRQEAIVLAELGTGRTNAAIALRLGLAETTVKSHVSNLFAKLNARSRTHAVVLAKRLGLLA
jgi:DNA-binding NarL/FixJ family response regulator